VEVLMNLTVRDLAVATFNGTVTSRQIAEVTGKKNKNIMRDCRDEFSNINGLDIGSFLSPSFYIDSHGREKEEYVLTEKATLQLFARYSKELRYLLIEELYRLRDENTRLLEERYKELEYRSKGTIRLREIFNLSEMSKDEIKYHSNRLSIISDKLGLPVTKEKYYYDGKEEHRNLYHRLVVDEYHKEFM
jgi:phage regulator Rha-like protein